MQSIQPRIPQSRQAFTGFLLVHFLLKQVDVSMTSLGLLKAMGKNNNIYIEGNAPFCFGYFTKTFPVK